MAVGDALTPAQSFKAIANRKIAIIMLMFAAHAVTETGILSHHTLSTEVVARDFRQSDVRRAYEYLDGDAHRTSFSWGEEAERFYSSASESADYFFRKTGQCLDFSHGVASLVPRCMASRTRDDDEDDQPAEKRVGSPHERDSEALASDDDQSIGNSVMSTEDVLSPNVQKHQQFVADKPFTPLSDNQARFQCSAPVWENVLSFLSWKEVLPTRGVSRFHFCQSLPFVTVARMPYTKLPALFIPARHDFDSCADEVEAKLKPRPLRASWSRTSAANPDDAVTLEKPADVGSSGTATSAENESPTAAQTNGDGSAPHRVFVGQLRRDGTVPMMRWMAHDVCGVPLSSILSVENHRNMLTGRGKGCAWMTLADAETKQTLIRAHHRMFYDVIDQVEGMWIVQPGQESVLQCEIEHRMRDVQEHHRHMPRRAIVIERPCAPSTTKVSTTASAMRYRGSVKEMPFGAPYSASNYADYSSPPNMHTHPYDAAVYRAFNYPYDDARDAYYAQQPMTAVYPYESLSHDNTNTYIADKAGSMAYMNEPLDNCIAHHSSNYGTQINSATYSCPKKTKTSGVTYEKLITNDIIEFIKPGMWHYNPYKAIYI